MYRCCGEKEGKEKQQIFFLHLFFLQKAPTRLGNVFVPFQGFMDGQCMILHGEHPLYIKNINKMQPQIQLSTYLLCSGVHWPVPWRLHVVMTECVCLRRMRQLIQTSLFSPCLPMYPRPTARMSTVSPGTPRRLGSLSPAVTMGR